ncbi:MAG TPA: hypothetical protein VET30_08550 [Pseudoxanthomonas sp.]|nr:hypothetical protein [Pseudoxanthomonas sp.]
MHFFKYVVLSMFLAATVAGCSGDNAEKAAAGAVSKAVELAKGAATGAGKGVEEGRKASTSADGAVIVSKGSELSAALAGEVLQATRSEAGTRVILGFTNAGAVPVRVTDLSVNNHVTALDEDGYACTTTSADAEFTVPAMAKLKVEMAFGCGDKTIAKVRLFDTEYVVAQDRIVPSR